MNPGADVTAAPASAMPDARAARPVISSLFRYSPGLIIVAIAICDLSRFADPDLWGHLRFGQAVISAGHIVRTDPYSYTAFGHPWLNHEWLTEVIMGALYNLAGVFGLKLMKLACASLVIIFLAAAESETGAPAVIQFAILISSAVTIAPQVQYRPQAFTFALLSALIYMLTRDLYGRRAHLWLAVPMLAVWANLHGGFILGIATLAIYTAVVGAQDIVAGRGTRRALQFAAITLLATLATLATPYGVGTWQAVGHALRNPFTRSVIVDWQPLTHQYATDWHSDQLSVMYLQLAISLIAALIFSFILMPIRDDLPLVVIAAVMSISAFISVRNIPAAVITVAIPLARHLPLALGRRWPAVGPHTGPLEPASRVHLAILASVSMLVFVQSDFFSNRLTSVDSYPVSACNFIRANKISGNLLSLFSWGEYEIWHLAPDNPVFMDGRYDTVYPEDVIRDFLLFTYNRDGGDHALNNYPTQLVLIPTDSSARKIMERHRDWSLIYKDDSALLYARADSAAARKFKTPATGVSSLALFP